MTIEEIKSVSIHQWLQENGYGDGWKRRQAYWYCSPFRTELTPSFRVDPNLNLWYDFGQGVGGNLINLVQRINPTWNNHEVLSFLEKDIQTKHLKYSKEYEVSHQTGAYHVPWNKQKESQTDSNTVVKQLTELCHPYLRDYINQRRIDYGIAQKFCKEVHYSLGGKDYYAIAFMNMEGGMEARNKYSKRCIGKKSISIIHPYEMVQTHCCIFEGFFDMLTYATIEKWMDIGIRVEHPCDYLVLNSTSCVKTSLPILKDYVGIHCFLDNDEAGKKATQMIMSSYPHQTTDESYRYNGYKDLNDVLNGKPIREHES